MSPLYTTPAFPVGNGPDFVNAAAKISADRSAEEVLELCHRIEAEEGRVRATRWAPRMLDIDLVAYGDAVLPDAQTQTAWRALTLEEQLARTPGELVLPHPRLQDRAFVLVPLADVAPDWVHPLIGKTVREMCGALDPKALAEVRKLE